MKKFFEDFKAFAMRGNVVDMTVGVVIGAAFGKIVSSLVSDIIMPPLGILIGGVSFTDLSLTLKEAVTDSMGEVITPAVVMNYGMFVQTIVDFIIIAFSIFVLVRFINSLHKKKEEPAAAPEEPKLTLDQELLTQIRDLLKRGGSSEK